MTVRGLPWHLTWDQEDIQTPEAKTIMEDLLPEWAVKFLEANIHYKDVNVVNNLGAKGLFPDINRKVGVLKTRIWDEVDSGREPTEEIIQDLIGHLFLMLAALKPETKHNAPTAAEAYAMYGSNHRLPPLPKTVSNPGRTIISDLKDAERAAEENKSNTVVINNHYGYCTKDSDHDGPCAPAEEAACSDEPIPTPYLDAVKKDGTCGDCGHPQHAEGCWVPTCIVCWPTKAGQKP